MNYQQRLSPTTFEAVEFACKALDLQQILLTPINSQPKEVIEIFNNAKAENQNVIGLKIRLLKILRNMYSFKNKRNTKHINSPKNFDNLRNSFITHIKANDSELALIYKKGAESSKDWTAEEKELLQLISQLVETDFLFDSDNQEEYELKRDAELKQVSYQILELQYVLPLVNSLNILEKTKIKLKSLDFCEGLEEFNEIENYLSRSLKVLNFAKESVYAIQSNYWLQTSENQKPAVEEIDIEHYISSFCNAYDSSLADIYYGHIYPIKSTQRKEIFIRSIILKNFMNAVFRNAVKFAKEDKAEIYVTSELNDLDLVIRVRDMGIGIPEDEIQHIAKPFFTASNNESEGACGFELSIIKRTVEEYGGSLSFQSVENEYTEVVCNLPYLADRLHDND